MSTPVPVAEKTFSGGVCALIVFTIISIPLGMLGAWVLQVIAGMYLPLLFPGHTLTFVQALAVRVFYATVVMSKPGSDEAFKKFSYGAIISKAISASVSHHLTVLFMAWMFWYLFVRGT